MLDGSFLLALIALQNFTRLIMQVSAHVGHLQLFFAHPLP